MHDVSDEQLWSWVDRDAPELRAFLARRPDQQARIDRLRADLQGLRALAAPVPPEFIGPYRVTGLLGAGGMGVVYAAVQQNPAREVAVKVMRDRLQADPGLAQRFAREAAALGRLQHPGIATIHEAGTTADGTPYLVMERVRGLPLTTWAREHDASPSQRATVLAAVARAVHAAHDAGVAHRDLKPGNVLVDGDGAPKLLDFGLARLIDGDAVAGTLTKPGGFAGTLGYVAPERLACEPLAGPVEDARSQLSDADVRADVYALGVMLFELLTGRLPHPVAGVSLADLVHAVCRGPTPLPSQVAPQVAPALDRVVAKAMARAPAQRYASAEALAVDLDDALAGRPVRAPATARARRRPWPWVVAAGASLLLAAWLFVAPREATSPRAPFDRLAWFGDRPEVRVGGDWFRLEGIDGVAAADLVAASRRLAPADWRTRFGTDLPRLMAAAGRPLGDAVELQLSDLDGTARYTRHDVPVTTSWGRALAAAGAPGRDDEVAVARQLEAQFDPRRGSDRRAPFVASRVRDGRLEVRLEDGDPYREWLAIDGHDVDELRRICQRAFGQDWHKRLSEDLSQVLVLLGRSVGERVDLQLRDEDGGVVTVRDVPMTETKRQRLVRSHA